MLKTVQFWLTIIWRKGEVLVIWYGRTRFPDTVPYSGMTLQSGKETSTHTRSHRYHFHNLIQVSMSLFKTDANLIMPCHLVML